MGELVRLSTPSPGEGKDVEVTDIRFLQEIIGITELFFPLPGETDDDIYTDIDVRDVMDQGLDEVGEEVPIVIAVHSPEDIIITALHGDVKMVAQPRGGGNGLNQFRAKIGGFDGAQPDPLGGWNVIGLLAEFGQ